MLAYTGKGQFQMQRLDLNHAVVEIAQLLEASIPKKVHLDLRLAEDLPPLDADPAQLEQVILNLVINAADAIGEREGTIRLATGFQELDETYLRGVFPGEALPVGPYLTLEVTDNGCGIPPEILDRIFDPFFTTKDKGRGLGLSAMLGILRAHRGGIKIYSEPGRGTTFRAYFPASSLRQGAVEGRSRPLPWRGQGTILVVDDDDDVRTSTAAQLEALGFETVHARDGLEAVETFKARHAELDLVFMDLSMPRMDGKEALESIRRLAPAARVILCSGFDRGTASATGGASPDAFLQKPFRGDDLRRVLREVLEGPAG
jgi:CheY-like chemotaxis protein/two-component sensor histidine kinase